MSVECILQTAAGRRATLLASYIEIATVKIWLTSTPVRFCLFAEYVRYVGNVPIISRESSRLARFNFIADGIAGWLTSRCTCNSPQSTCLSILMLLQRHARLSRTSGYNYSVKVHASIVLSIKCKILMDCWSSTQTRDLSTIVIVAR